MYHVTTESECRFNGSISFNVLINICYYLFPIRLVPVMNWVIDFMSDLLHFVHTLFLVSCENTWKETIKKQRSWSIWCHVLHLLIARFEGRKPHWIQIVSQIPVLFVSWCKVWSVWLCSSIRIKIYSNEADESIFQFHCSKKKIFVKLNTRN